MERFPARRDVPWDEVEGRIVIALPRELSWMQKLVSRLFPLPASKTLTLEDHAARIWLACDGTRTEREVADAVADVPAARERTALFLADLDARGLVALQDAPAQAQDRARGLGLAQGYRLVRCRRCQRAHPLAPQEDARWFCPHCRKLNRLRAPGT